MRRARIFLFLLVAAAVWLPALHLFYGIGALERGRLVRAMADHTSPTSTRTAPMRAVNPEWDFMQRTYSVLGLANLARRPGVTEAERATHLARIDGIIDDTIATDTSLGAKYFLLPYANERPFVDPESRSLFVDGEIVMMIAARELVERRPEILDEARTRAARVARTMSRSPSLSAESYPDDCWTFCNTTALAGLVTLDRVTGDDHGALARAWVAYAKEHLVDPQTGILVSRYTHDARIVEGPEGSSIWMTASNLLVVDEAFAKDQYARARRELGVSFLGFGWAREWPRGLPMHPDVDSGPIVPLLHASAGSSGLAILGASAFHDESWRDALLASLELGGFPDREHATWRASNAVGDAVVFYSLSMTP